jgi:hypothetical protein
VKKLYGWVTYSLLTDVTIERTQWIGGIGLVEVDGVYSGYTENAIL